MRDTASDGVKTHLADSSLSRITGPGHRTERICNGITIERCARIEAMKAEIVSGIAQEWYDYAHGTYADLLALIEQNVVVGDHMGGGQVRLCLAGRTSGEGKNKGSSQRKK